MSSPVQAHTEQRRKLIKAAAGASAVFTLPSGAALANVSATCDQKSLKLYQDAAAKPISFTGAPDGWMRIKLQKYKMQSKIVGQTGMSWGEGILFDAVYYRVITDTSGVNKAVLALEVNKAESLNGQFYYGLAHYNGPGGKPGLVLDQQLASKSVPIAGASCWNSLTGATLNSNTIIP